MRRASRYLVTGAVAGFAGVIGWHTVAAQPSLLAAGKPAAAGTGQAAAGARGNGRGAASGHAARQARGAVVPYGYGELAVRVTVRGNTITGLSVPVLRTAESYSQNLAQQVIPTLRSEVLSAHGARISAVSGATYTSEAYARSVQSALDQLHVN